MSRRQVQSVAEVAAARSWLLHGMLVILAALTLTPFVWLLCAAFKRNEDFFTYIFLPWPDMHKDEAFFSYVVRGWQQLHTLTWENFRLLFVRQPFLRWMENSILVTSLHTSIVVALSSLGGFALAKYQFCGKKVLQLVMLATMMLPSQVLLTSGWELMYKFHWLNSYAAIIVPSAVSVFGMFLFRQAMSAVPDELLAAGRVDGCSELRLWWEVALSIVRPMIGAFTLLSFMSTWNSFLWPQIVLEDPAKYTLPIGMANMIGLPEYETPYGMLMAGTLLSILPVMGLFFVLQRDFIAGLTSGAVKG